LRACFGLVRGWVSCTLLWVLSCGAEPEGHPSAEPEPDEKPSREPEPDAHVDARAIWNLKCAPCHGGDFTGGAGGIDLTERLPELSDQQAFQSIKNGVPPRMPAWSESTTDQEIEALVAFLRSEIE
jgi:mono/diheme cytochrome c family protein